jgi:hypothetical protein
MGDETGNNPVFLSHDPPDHASVHADGLPGDVFRTGEKEPDGQGGKTSRISGLPDRYVILDQFFSFIIGDTFDLTLLPDDTVDCRCEMITGSPPRQALWLSPFQNRWKHR